MAECKPLYLTDGTTMWECRAFHDKYRLHHNRDEAIKKFWEAFGSCPVLIYTSPRQ